MGPQIKSKKRVSKFGEVYTNKREITAMLDLVKAETQRIESRFLEPAAGNGNFLIEILARKLAVVKKKYRKNQTEYERYAFLAMSSIYGIDILQDNVQECRQRLFAYFNKEYTKLFKNNCCDKVKQAITYILSLNIICGDGLTGLKEGAEAQPIIFAEWTMLKNKVKRRDFAMNDMLAYEIYSTPQHEVLKPRKTYKMVDFKEVASLEWNEANTV